MAKKHILYLEYEHTYKAIGIFSALKDYRLCWMLNNHLGIDLKRMPDFYMPPDNTGKTACYPVYQHEQDNLFLNILLVANKSEDGLLFKTPKNLDFLLLLKSPDDLFNITTTISTINKIPQVLAAVLLNNLPPKRTSEFFFDLEMYLTQM